MIPNNVHDLFLNRKNISEDQKKKLYETHINMLYKTACDLEVKSSKLEKEAKRLLNENQDWERRYYELNTRNNRT